MLLFGLVQTHEERLCFGATFVLQATEGHVQIAFDQFLRLPYYPPQKSKNTEDFSLIDLFFFFLNCDLTKGETHTSQAGQFLQVKHLDLGQLLLPLQKAVRDGPQHMDFL